MCAKPCILSHTQNMLNKYLLTETDHIQEAEEQPLPVIRQSYKAYGRSSENGMSDNFVTGY